MSVVTGVLGASSHVWSEAQMSRLSGLGSRGVDSSVDHGRRLDSHG